MSVQSTDGFLRVIKAVTNALIALLEWLGAGVLVLVVIGLLLAGAIILLESSHVETKDWVEFIGICVASVTSAASVLVGDIVRRRQARDAVELERVKAQFASGLAYFNARLSQITEREFNAYFLLWSAVARLYRALYSLQEGRYDEDALRAAQNLCEKAEGHSLLVEKDDRLAFYSFWQRSRYIWGEADKIRRDPNALRQLWAAEIKGSPSVKGYYDTLEAIQADYYNRLELKFKVPAEQLQQVLRS